MVISGLLHLYITFYKELIFCSTYTFINLYKGCSNQVRLKLIWCYQNHSKIVHAWHRTIWWMNFEQNGKQFCARPDKNNNMNLTLDIDRKCYFPPIWWKQLVSINKIGILKTASTVLGYIPKKLIVTMGVS